VETSGVSENVALIRRITAAFNARDIEAFVAELDPAAELEPLRALLEGKRYTGPEGAREMFADFDEDWEYLQLEIDDVREAGEEVALLGRLLSRGRASRVDLEVPIGFVWRVRNGKLLHGKTFSEPADALRAVGLE
jgi:ketosteroid isomerase-like protein